MNHTTRGLRAQFKYADKIHTSYVAILGGDEAEKGVVKLRDMQSGDEWETPIDEAPLILRNRIAVQAEEEMTL